jgi:hypothetical protein
VSNGLTFAEKVYLAAQGGARGRCIPCEKAKAQTDSLKAAGFTNVRLNAKPAVYNLDYYEKMLRQNAATGQAIADIRWGFVKDAKASTVLDYGSGVGFFRAHRPEEVTVDTFDINQNR